MCFRGNAAVPVADGETCSRIYDDWGARRTDGQPVECGILEPGVTGFNHRVLLTSTVGQCFDQRRELASSTRLGRCNKRFPAGYTHWRLDLSESQCLAELHPGIMLRR